MAITEEDYVEDAEDYDEEEEDDDYEIEEENEEDVEDADQIEADPEDLLRNAPYIRGLEPLLGARGGPGATSRLAARAAASSQPREWTGLRQLPDTTQKTFLELLGKLREENKTKLTILLIGKTGVGKSSTTNSIFAERVANVMVMQSDTSKAQSFARTAAGFTLTIIDTPGALEGDAVNGAALSGIAYEIRGKPVDAVLYVNRLDDYRVDASDVQVIEGVTRVLGENIWSNTFIALTHGRLTSLPGNLSYDEYVEKRAGALREAIHKHGSNKFAELPVVVIENSSRASTNADGEKLLGNKRPWLPDLMRAVTQKAMEWQPYRYSPGVVRRHDPNKKRRWLIPLVLLAQIAFKVLVLDRVLEEDGITGDAYGLFEPEFVKEERERVKREKERARKRKEAKKQRQKLEEANGARPRNVQVIDDDDDSSDDEE